jgi:competence protein ComEA
VGAVASAGGWLHDRLPPTLQGRAQLGAAHLTVVALAVASVLGVTAWWALRSAATSEEAVSPVAMSPSVAQSPTPLVSTAPSPAPAAEPRQTSTGAAVVVDVEGKVRHRGIATLPMGSRVVDALKAAGGARRGVDLGTLNLARVLVDGEQLLVGMPPPKGPAASAATGSTDPPPGELVNINTADQATLETLPGVGPVTAQAIMGWREENGGFRSVDELLEVSGIGDATLAKLAPLVTI